MGVVGGNAGLSGGWVSDGNAWCSTTPIREVSPARGGCGVAPSCAVEWPPLRVWSSCVKQLPLGAGGRSPSSRVPVSFCSTSAVGRGSAHPRGLPSSRGRSSFKLVCRRLCRCGRARLSASKDRLPQGLSPVRSDTNRMPRSSPHRTTQLRDRYFGARCTVRYDAELHSSGQLTEHPSHTNKRVSKKTTERKMATRRHTTHTTEVDKRAARNLDRQGARSYQRLKPRHRG